ncbi:hypothetical protein K7432_009424 [Basidiobolus ranarum]|uniref:Late embryogenesis abundant protein LEA-2 subgroup domain-containing protein n=1 Tax=Basidiobolus ranarum TaxID=34480 RepID=A0ABR2WQE4_9FUNG
MLACFVTKYRCATLLSSLYSLKHLSSLLMLFQSTRHIYLSERRLNQQQGTSNMDSYSSYLSGWKKRIILLGLCMLLLCQDTQCSPLRELAKAPRNENLENHIRDILFPQDDFLFEVTLENPTADIVGTVDNQYTHVSKFLNESEFDSEDRDRLLVPLLLGTKKLLSLIPGSRFALESAIGSRPKILFRLSLSKGDLRLIRKIITEKGSKGSIIRLGLSAITKVIYTFLKSSVGLLS